MAKLLKKSLDLLPFDGSKTKFGGILAILGLLSQYVHGLDLVSIFQAIMANPTRSGIIAVIVGLLHKELKKRFPDPVQL